MCASVVSRSMLAVQLDPEAVLGRLDVFMRGRFFGGALPGVSAVACGSFRTCLRALRELALILC